MKHGSLFSGIGGFDLAAQQMGWENVFQVEIDPWCRKVLKKNFPTTQQYGDIKEFKGEQGSVDILTGGFPCQPFSHAGKREGTDDDRYLWPEYLRIIREIKPTYIVGENVAGLLSMGSGIPFEEQVLTGVASKADLFSEEEIVEYTQEELGVLNGIIDDLEREGYTVETFLIPACGVGAWHRRDRVWIIAYLSSEGLQDGRGPQMGQSREEQESERQGGSHGGNQNVPKPPHTNPNSIGSHRKEMHQLGETELRDEQECDVGSVCEDVSDTESSRMERSRTNREQIPQAQAGSRISGCNSTGNGRRDRSTEPRMGLLVDGLPSWMAEPAGVPRVTTGEKDRVNKLKGLGNAIVPQVALEIFKAIDQL